MRMDDVMMIMRARVELVAKKGDEKMMRMSRERKELTRKRGTK